MPPKLLTSPLGEKLNVEIKLEWTNKRRIDGQEIELKPDLLTIQNE